MAGATLPEPWRDEDYWPRYLEETYEHESVQGLDRPVLQAGVPCRRDPDPSAEGG